MSGVQVVTGKVRQEGRQVAAKLHAGSCCCRLRWQAWWWLAGERAGECRSEVAAACRQAGKVASLPSSPPPSQARGHMVSPLKNSTKGWGWGGKKCKGMSQARGKECPTKVLGQGCPWHNKWGKGGQNGR